MDIKSNLIELSKLSAIGTVDSAAKKAAEIMNEYCPVTQISNLSYVGEIKGESDYTLLLDAHIDEVGFIVTHISEDGFLTVGKCGGIDLRHLPASPVIIHGKEMVAGVFASIPPHLSEGEETPDSITDYKIDTMLGAKAKEIISVGDFVTYKVTPSELLGSRISGKSLDNRASVCALIEIARRLKGKNLPVSLKLLMSDAEELGLRGATTAAYGIEPDEAVVIDVSFGNGPDVSQYECGNLGEGAMLGISPVLCRDISDKLISISKENKLKYQTEVMGGRTSTNADVISVSKCGVKTGLISIPLRNMHTPNEVVDLEDIKSVCDILEKYIMSGGVKND